MGGEKEWGKTWEPKYRLGGRGGGTRDVWQKGRRWRRRQRSLGRGAVGKSSRVMAKGDLQSAMRIHFWPVRHQEAC